MDDKTTLLLYQQIAGRWDKVVWTHKIHEEQADIYMTCSRRYGIAKQILSSANSVGIITILCGLISNDLWVQIITAITSIATAFVIWKCENCKFESKAEENKQYAAKCHHLRNLYESLMTDIRAGITNTSDIVARREELEEAENSLYMQIAPHTTSKAVDRASVALNKRKESTTTPEELDAHLPDFLKC